MTDQDQQRELEKQEGMAAIPAVVRNAVYRDAANLMGTMGLGPGNAGSPLYTETMRKVAERYRVLARLIKRAYKAGEKSVGITHVQARIRQTTAQGWEVQFNGEKWLRPADLPVGSEARLVWDAAARVPPPDPALVRADQGALVIVALHVEVRP